MAVSPLRRRRPRSAYLMLCLILALSLAFCASTASAQQTSIDYITVRADTFLSTATATQNSRAGSLNDANTKRAATSGTAFTLIPSIDFGSSTVPYLLQRPATTTPLRKERARVQSSFSSCSDDSLDLVEPQYRINISAVYAQFDSTPSAPHLDSGTSYTEGVLRIAGVGDIASKAYGASNSTFGAIQIQSRFLTFNIFSNLTYLCDELAPTNSDETNILAAHSSCTYGPGTVAFGVAIPLNSTYPMGTIWTRVLLIDPSTPALAIACVDVPVSRYNASRWYWSFFLWLPMALFIGFFVTVSLARVITATATRSRAFKNRAREGSAPSFLRDHVNPIIISALSGQGMVLSPALLRYATPGCWEILFHLQFIAAIAMISVHWPDFIYPFFAKASWASLVGNVTFVQGAGDQSLVNPLATNATLPSGDLGAQFNNASSPLYLNSSAPQAFLNLGDVYTGIPAYARIVGLQTADLFGTCLAIWLVIIAVFVAVAIAGWVVDTVTIMASKIKQTRADSGIDYQLTDGDMGTKSKGGDLYVDTEGNTRDVKTNGYGFLGVWTRGVHLSPRLHFAALHGNVVRALAMFHLPVTIFSVYHFVDRSEHSSRTFGLAVAAFVAISVLMPAWLLWKVAANPTRKLYDDIETLLALGPIYNVFSPGSQLFWIVNFTYSLTLGIVIGAGYQSGSAQAILLLILEVLLALATNLWLPWGEGAMMGPISFTTSVLRVITAVLVVLLAPIVGMSSQATGWIAYVILVLQGIFFAFASTIMTFKLFEATVRLCGRVAYDERVNARSGGIGGAIRQIRRRRDKILQLSQPRKPGRHSRTSISSQQMMLSRDGVPSSRPSSFIGSSMSMSKSGMASPADAPIALTRSRQVSFASYLDYGNAAPMGLPKASDPLRSVYNGPYAAYFHHEGDDEDADIMAAMPPTGPRPLGPTHMPHWAIGDSGGPSKGKSKGTGFERVGGGRATDSNPYASLPGGAEVSASSMRYGTGGGYKGDGSSTAAAAQFARAHSRRQARTATSGGFGGIFMNRRSHSSAHGNEGGVNEAEDDEDPWAGTWGSSTLSSTQHGPWNGVAKMQAALAAMRNRFMGYRPEASSTSHHGIAEEDEEGMIGPPFGSGGFQVIRAPRTGGVQMAQDSACGTQEQRYQEGPRHDREFLWKYENNELMDSTAMAAAASLSRPTSRHGIPVSSGPSSRPASRRVEATAEFSVPSSTFASLSQPPVLKLRHLTGSDSNLSLPNGAKDRSSSPSMLSSSALGILGADMQRAASEMGHDDAEEDARRRERKDEARYWLPANRDNETGSDDGVIDADAKCSTRHDTSRGPSATKSSHRAEPMSAKIELIKP